MTSIAHDGTPLQAGTEPSEHRLTGEHAHFSAAGLREMVVIDRKFIDETGNSSRSFVEYTCRDIHTGENVPRCRRANAMGGLDNGDDNVLRPSTLVRESIAPLTKQTPAIKTDGDRVLVGFIEGSRSRPIIIGVLTHSSSKYGATQEQGDRRFTIHNGTTIEIDKDGQYTIVHKSGSTLKFLDNGDVTVTPAGNLLLAGADAVPTDGVINGSAIDPFTGMTQAALQNTSSKVFAKKG